jgi:hypothetical protein
MTEPHVMRVFVNGSGVSVPHGSTVADAVRAFNSDEADEVVAGTRAATDSRGLPIAPDAVLAGGAVLRVVSARALRGAEDSA